MQLFYGSDHFHLNSIHFFTGSNENLIFLYLRYLFAGYGRINTKHHLSGNDISNMMNFVNYFILNN